jgi:hypothetical protein
MKTIARIVCSLIILLGGISQTAIAQTSQITFGVRGGVGMSFLSDNFPLTKSPGFSFNGGGLINIPLGGMWSIQPEMLYSYESGKRTESDTGTFLRISEDGRHLGVFKNVTIDYSPKFMSIRFPILLKASFGEQKQASVLMGPNFGYILSGKAIQEISDSLRNVLVSETFDIGSIHHFQVGLTVGVDYRIFDNLLIDVRFNYNVTKYVESSWYNSSFSNILFGVGYVF